MEIISAYARELSRLKIGPTDGERIPGIGIETFTVRCDGNAKEVLARAVSVLSAVLRECRFGWPEELDWHTVLPENFVSACAKEKTQEESDRWMVRWRALNPEQRKQEDDEPWSVDEWVGWLEPDERAWQWWDVKVCDPNEFEVQISVDEWPFAFGAIFWLFLGSGALKVLME